MKQKLKKMLKGASKCFKKLKCKKHKNVNKNFKMYGGFLNFANFEKIGIP